MAPLPNIELRDVKEDDLAIFFEIQKEPNGYKMAGVLPRDETAFFRHWRENILSNSEGTIQTVESDGEAIGYVTSFTHGRLRLVAYWIGSNYWGRGIATSALSQFLISHEKRRPLYAFVVASNPGSYRVLQKCGFQRAGRSALVSDGVEEFKFELP